MPLAPGTRLGPYEILSSIGAGGMGEVYKARDSRLDRTVAVKISNEQFSERFECEARAVAALNHSHICQLYDVGPNYLVMEYIEGAPLKGPLPLDQALKYAAQICDSLDAAHKKAITHRDLKPANILVTKTGIKLLDFGLAKMAQASAPMDDATLKMALTGKNEMVGTLYYMSPEQLEAQANGKEVDARSDIFSFGVVLYEMLTGKRAFDGASQASVIAAIMERPAPSIAAIAPLALDRLLQRCLAKDPDERWQSARDLKAELEWIAIAPRELSAVPTVVTQHQLLPWIVAMLIVALSSVSFIAFRAAQPLEPQPLVRLDVDLGPDVSLADPDPVGSSVILSPDGTRLVYAASTPGRSYRLFTRRLDQPTTTELPGTEGAWNPFFLPDGQSVGFFGSNNKYNKISVEGGTLLPWGEDRGAIILGPDLKGLSRFPPGGGPATQVTELAAGEFWHLSSQILPGDKAALFASYKVAAAQSATVEVVSFSDRRRKALIPGGTSPRYVPSGHLLYVSGSTLFAIPFDLDRLETRGKAVPVLDDVVTERRTGSAEYDISRTGTLVYRKRARGTDSGMMALQWLDANGKKEPLAARKGQYDELGLSPDGKRLAVTMSDGRSQDVWVYEWQRDAWIKLTFGGGIYTHPAWSPDGRFVVFGSAAGGMYWARGDGSAQPQALTQTHNAQAPTSFSPDGRRLAYTDFSSSGEGAQIWTVPLDDAAGQLKAGKAENFLEAQYSNGHPVFSPDGHWLAYESDESGKTEVHVRAFPPPAFGQGGQWVISTGGGEEPNWSRTNHELLYQAGDQIMAVGYSVKGGSFVAEKPRVWAPSLGGKEWALAPDSKRLVVMAPAESPETPKTNHEVVFLLNFFDELRRKVPLDGK